MKLEKVQAIREGFAAGIAGLVLPRTASAARRRAAERHRIATALRQAHDAAYAAQAREHDAMTRRARAAAVAASLVPRRGSATFRRPRQ